MTCTIGSEHGIRVTATWMNRDDLTPTYAGLLIKHSPGGTGTLNYAGLKVDYDDYAELLNNAGASGVDEIENITEWITGLRIIRGRSSIGEPVQAGTMQMTLNDEDGRHDPRNPPAGGSRSGSKITVEIDPELTDQWTGIFTGFVESWTRQLDAGDDVSEISATVVDAFTILGRAKTVPLDTAIAPNELGGARINRILDAASWIPKWGPKNINPGSVPMTKTKLDQNALDDCHDVTRSEDGIFYITHEGEFYWNDKYWRGLRRRQVILVDLTGKGTDLHETILCPYNYQAIDDDLDMVNRAIVWRSTKNDPLVDGNQPEPVKKQNIENPDGLGSANKSIATHGLISEEYADLPHAQDAHSQTLANVLVSRLCGPTNNLGEFEVPLAGRGNDVVKMVWGDEILVYDQRTPDLEPEIHNFEYVGIEHIITPNEWNARISVDRWQDVPEGYLPALGVDTVINGGIPAQFTPPGATVPKNLAALQALGALGETTAWTSGQFVWLADGSRAYWNGTAWVKGGVNDPTGVTEGVPGAFTPPTCFIPLDLKVLRSIGALGETTAWRIGQYVNLQNLTRAWWTGTEWIAGVAPTEATAGTPGTYNPAGPPGFASADALNIGGVIPVPTTPWDAGQYVPVTGAETAAHWRGDQWVPGASPGYPKEPLRWDLGNWNYNVWAEPPAPTGPPSCVGDVIYEPFNDLTAWTNANGVITTGRTGNGLRFGGVSAGSVTYTIPVPLQSPTFTFGFAFRVSSLASTQMLAQLRAVGGGTNMYGLRVNADGSLQALMGASSNNGLSAVGAVTINTWNFVEMRVKMSNTAGEREVRLNGVPVIGPNTAIDTNGGFTEGQPAGVFALIGSVSAIIDYDDLYLATGGCPLKGDYPL
jgi:hypothetical protein